MIVVFAENEAKKTPKNAFSMRILSLWSPIFCKKISRPSLTLGMEQKH